MRSVRFWLAVVGMLAIGLCAPAGAWSAEKTKAPAELSDAQKKALDQVWAKVYDRPERLRTLDHPAVCFLDIQHPDKIREQFQKLAKPVEQARVSLLRERFKQLSKLDCLVVHQTEVVGADLDRPQVKAILISGRSKTLSRARDEQFYELIRTTKIPLIGFCGGCQLIGQAYAAKVGPMRKLREGEKDLGPTYHPGMYKEWGFMKVQVGKADPLFASLTPELTVKEMHAFQMLDPPKEFDLLASTAECRVQAVKHRQRVLYGVQFHPEAYDDDHPDGRALLANFFRIALGTSDRRPSPPRPHSESPPATKNDRHSTDKEIAFCSLDSLGRNVRMLLDEAHPRRVESGN